MNIKTLEQTGAAISSWGGHLGSPFLPWVKLRTHLCFKLQGSYWQVWAYLPFGQSYAEVLGLLSTLS